MKSYPHQNHKSTSDIKHKDLTKKLQPLIEMMKKAFNFEADSIHQENKFQS